MTNGRQGSVNNATEGGVSGEHPDTGPLQFLVGTSTTDQLNTLQLPLRPVFCWKVEDIRFEFDSSFVTFNTDGSPDPATNPNDRTSDPTALPYRKNDDIRDELKALADLVNANPGCPLSVFGHADPVGPAVDPDGYNKALSGRRATAIYALLISGTQLGTAVGLWQQIANEEHWGDGQKNVMQRATNLPAGTSMSALISSYLPKICPQDLKLGSKDFLAQGADSSGQGDYQGCSSFNSLIIFSQTKEDSFAAADHDQNQAIYDARNLANAPNRRVMVLIFPKGSKVIPSKWPCPSVKGDKSGCIKRFWSDGQSRRSNRLPDKDRKFEETQDTFACRFYQRLADRSPCHPILRSFRIRLFDRYADPLPRAPYIVSIAGQTRPLANANADGDIVVTDVAVPATCHIFWSRPETFKSSATGNEAPKPDDFEFSLEVFVDIEESEADSKVSAEQGKEKKESEDARKRLQNLGFWLGEDLQQNIMLFQRELALEESGLLKDIDSELKKRHAACDPPSRYNLGSQPPAPQPGPQPPIPTPDDDDTSEV